MFLPSMENYYIEHVNMLSQNVNHPLYSTTNSVASSYINAILILREDVSTIHKVILLPRITKKKHHFEHSYGYFFLKFGH